MSRKIYGIKCLKLKVNLLLMMLVLCFATAICHAERWEYIGVPVYYGTDTRYDAGYIDVHTLKYNPSTRIARFWVKGTYNDKLMHMDDVEFDFKNKKYRRLRYVGWDTKGKVESYSNAKWITYDTGHPCTKMELALDYICAKYGLPLLHVDNSVRWKWLLSTDEMTFTYAVDSVKFQKNPDTVSFVGRLTYLDGRTVTNKFKIDFTNYKYYRAKAGVEVKDILPDTFYEQVADAVANIIGMP